MSYRILLIRTLAVFFLFAFVGKLPAHAALCRTIIASGGPSIDPADLEIDLFTYRGTIIGQPSQAMFDAFRGMLEIKLINLKNTIVQGVTNSSDYEYLSEISLVYKGDDIFPHAKAVDDWIKNQGSMQVLRGSLLGEGEMTYRVYSQFYLGEMPEFLPQNIITVDLPVVGTEFANTKDSHTLVILYSLLMDARRSKCPTNVISRYLKVANDIIADLERRAAVVGDISLIKDAFVQSRQDFEDR